MKKISIVLLLGITILSGGLLAAPKKAAEVELVPLITAIEVRGNSAVPEKEIVDVIFSRVGNTITDDKIRGDLKAIYTLGYFADVSSSFEAFAGGSKVIFNVVENPKINTIVIEGNSVYSTAELQAKIKTKPGNLLNFKGLQDDIAMINELYKKDGYMLSRIADVDTDKKTGTLTFKIVEGRLESIVLAGNDSTKDYVILREFKSLPGTVLNEVQLKKDLRNVFNLGFFSEITPNFEPGSTKDNIVLELKIKESRTSTINFGGGWGEREGGFGFIDLSINNLMGTAQGLLIRGQVGQQLSSYQFKYTNPWFWPEKLGDKTSFTFRRWLTVGRDVFQTDQQAQYNGADVSFGKPLSGNYSVTFTLGRENVDPYGGSTFEAYISNTLAVTLAFDTRDFWLNPKEGRYYTLELKQGFKQASANSTFSKATLDLNHYYPVADNQVAAFHSGFGAGTGDVPIGELYWAGGANTVRGYYPSEAHKGTLKIILNAEYRLNFSDMFQGVFFYDWGNAWSGDAPDTANFLSGWGPGMRINTPLGPIRLDYGVPAGKTFSEGIMHFSIGQAF
ncbi:MAG: BamA/TamA family outer membrane protein [Candidatus Margulisbacteria bacterium]|nr:BamA/TamA family outer membrane protein [Candidatus Margulisiibacteriota bacterium]MBU1617734.1 BamA/TamA family outer membrane protein [Candidatus Margulisiibacteriota bacterium]